MNKKIILILLVLILPLVACNKNDDNKTSESEFAEKENFIKKEIKKFDEKDAEILENIFKSNPKKALYYKTYTSEDTLIEESMNVEWENKEISYRKNLYNSTNPIESAILFDDDNIISINISKNEYYSGKSNKDYNSNEIYPDTSFLYDSILASDIKEIKEDENSFTIIFANDTYKLYDKDYILTEGTGISAGEVYKTILSDKREDLDKIFDEFKDMTKNMKKVDSLDKDTP